MPVSTIATQRTASPLLAGAPRAGSARRSSRRRSRSSPPTSSRCSPATIPSCSRRHERMIGYWFWELEHIPEGMRLGDRAGRRDLGRLAVRRRCVRRRVTRPGAPRADPDPGADRRRQRRRADFAPLADAGDRFVFVVGVRSPQRHRAQEPARRDRGVPPGVRPGRGSAARRQDDERRACGGRSTSGCSPQRDERPDVVVWDAHLSRADQMALVAAADCLVSLHRSEGLGLHLAEAMWLGTPTIATRYSGNVDFMDDTCALLVDHELTRVSGGQGVYPASRATWADPDLDAGGGGDARARRRPGAARPDRRRRAAADGGAAVARRQPGGRSQSLLGLRRSATIGPMSATARPARLDPPRSGEHRHDPRCAVGRPARAAGEGRRLDGHGRRRRTRRVDIARRPTLRERQLDEFDQVRGGGRRGDGRPVRTRSSRARPPRR